MKTLKDIYTALKTKELERRCFDGRDFRRLADYFPEDKLDLLGMELVEGKSWTPKEFTEENVLKQLESDIAFGFEKALNKRGISASFMFAVVKMWLWVLDDKLKDSADSYYAQYGLPLFKAVAVKYGFKNMIGEDTGCENKYG